MPITRVSLRKGKSVQYKQAVLESIYQAMHAVFNVPEDDKFMIVHEHEASDFVFGNNYLDIVRSEDLLIIQLTVSNTRTIEQKKALFAKMVELLGNSPGVRKEDVFINLLEVNKENWSFGNGLAQYA